MGKSNDKKPINNKIPLNSEIAPLFPDFKPETNRKKRTYKRIDQAIWTDSKARFVQQYLRFFVQITKHGAYIDGFAGPQSFKHLDAWSAALVLESEPKWLRQFFLCELKKPGIAALKKLVASQPSPVDKKGKKLPRSVEILPGDFNVTVGALVRSGKISQKEATFCLLDQRTFECHWATLQKLANYKKAPHNKIELLYFLGVGWLHRALSGIRTSDKALKWWGKPNWRDVKDMRSIDIANLVRDRFHKELGYEYVAAYPIFDRKEGNKIMYYMIHASDHDEAPALMIRAHRRAVRELPPVQTLLFEGQLNSQS